jgi:hypothetical protein
MRKPFLRASAFMGSLERNTSAKRCPAPRLLARHSMSAMSSVPRPLAAPVVCDRKCEFAFEPIGCRRIARLANRDRCAIDVGLSGPTVADPQVLVSISAFDLSIGIHPAIISFLLASDWQRARAVAREFRSEFVSSGYQPDGLLVRAGASWLDRSEESPIGFA